MYLQSGNLSIRNATIDDASTLCNWWNDGAVMAHAGFPNGLGTTTHAVADLLKQDSDQSCRLILEIDDVPAGEMNYRTVAEKIAEIGIKICDINQQGKGYGPQFLELLIRYLFDEMGYHKIILDTNAKNVRAQHVYEKLGFMQIAVHLDAWRNQLGEWQSSIDYELTRESFNQK